jgi:hypothetical protein
MLASEFLSKPVKASDNAFKINHPSPPKKISDRKVSLLGSIIRRNLVKLYGYIVRD